MTFLYSLKMLVCSSISLCSFPASFFHFIQYLTSFTCSKSYLFYRIYIYGSHPSFIPFQLPFTSRSSSFSVIPFISVSKLNVLAGILNLIPNGSINCSSLPRSRLEIQNFCAQIHNFVTLNAIVIVPHCLFNLKIGMYILSVSFSWIKST